MLLSEICGLVSVGCCLWREGGSAIQWSESRRTRNHTLLSYLRLPQPEGPLSHIYIPQEQGGPVIPPGTGFLLRRLLRLTGLRDILILPQAGGLGPLIYIPQIESKAKVTLRPTVSHSVSTEVEVEVTLWLTVSVSMSWCRAHSGICDLILLPVWKLRSCFCGVPSPTRGQVCNLQCNHSMVRVVQNP
jgi:hypothetical protein